MTSHRLLCLLAATGALGISLGISGKVTADPAYNRASAVWPRADLDHGKALAATCLACHGADGPAVGDPAYHPPKLRHQSVSYLFHALEDYRNGNRKSDIMEPMAAGLSEQDMRDVSAYLSGPVSRAGPPPGAPAGLPPAGARKPAEAATGPGLTEMKQVCSFCHGMTGQGEMDGVPSVGGQHQDYLKYALEAYRTGARRNETMAAVVKHLTPQQIEAVTRYMAAQNRLEVAQ